ncbi:MAG TPA: DUF1648 domain-containing protein [Thermaerobacter sp.]
MDTARNDGWRLFQAAWRRAPDTLEMALELVALAGLGVSAGLAAYYGPRLSGRVPVHFDLAGRPDRFGGAGALWEGVVVSLFLYGLLTAVPRLPVRWLNVPVQVTERNAARVARAMRYGLGVLKIFLVWTFTYITWRSIAVARGAATGLGAWFIPGLVAGGDLLLVLFIWLMWRAERAPGR